MAKAAGKCKVVRAALWAEGVELSATTSLVPALLRHELIFLPVAASR